VKTIDTLPADIYSVLESGKLTQEGIQRFCEELKAQLLARFTEEKGEPALRMSNLGEPCDRKLYWRINDPESGEPLSGQTLLKFLYGDLVELLVLFLAEEAGHTVEGRQDELVLEGIKGHRDAIVDGVLCDVKSASGYGYQKFKNHALEQDDPFGYLVQLGSYLQASASDPRLKSKTEAAFIAVNKENGAICVDTYRPPQVTPKTIARKKDMLEASNPPGRSFDDVPDGASGNRKLGTNCSYCSFRERCWPGLRTFIYSSGPRFLTKVARTPDVKEVTNDQDA
jgi:hypothetical protein